jgi:hypothetical protein
MPLLAVRLRNSIILRLINPLFSFFGVAIAIALPPLLLRSRLLRLAVSRR